MGDWAWCLVSTLTSYTSLPHPSWCHLFQPSEPHGEVVTANGNGCMDSRKQHHAVYPGKSSRFSVPAQTGGTRKRERSQSTRPPFQFLVGEQYRINANESPPHARKQQLGQCIRSKNTVCVNLAYEFLTPNSATWKLTEKSRLRAYYASQRPMRVQLFQANFEK